MASGLSAAAVVLMFLVQNSEAVAEVELAGLVANLLNVYRPTDVNGNTPMFSLAISIPLNTETNRYDFSQVTAVDSGQDVRNTLNQCQVYEGRRVVASTLLKWPDVRNQCPDSPIPDHWNFVRDVCPNARVWADVNLSCTKKIQIKSGNGAVEHAEYRVLEKFNILVNRLNTEPSNPNRLSRNDLMLFYVYKSPCDSRCSSVNNRFSILTAISAITNWQNYAVVFSGIFVPVATKLTPAELETNRRTSLTNLGNVIHGVGNIYRCVEGHPCSNCADLTGQGGVARACVSDNTGM